MVLHLDHRSNLSTKVIGQGQGQTVEMLILLHGHVLHVLSINKVKVIN